MNDAYVELLVKRKNSTAATVLRGFLAAIAIMFLLFIVIAPAAGGIWMVGAIVFFALSYLVQYNTTIEYEYLYLDKQLTIDKIKNRTKRKKAAEFDLSSMEVLAPATSHQLDSYQRQDIKVRDFSTGEKEGKPYALILRSGGQTQKILIEVNDDLLRQITMIAPRKVFKD